MDPLTLAAVRGCSSVASNLAASKVKEWFQFVNDYDKNIKHFNRLHQLLVSKEQDVQARVEAGERGGEEVRAQVKNWLEWVEQLLREAHNIHDDDCRELFTDKEVRRATEKCCFKLVGWNPKFRHHLSLKAKEMADLIEERIYELDEMQNLTINTGPPSLGSTDQGDFCQLLESRQQDVEQIIEALKSNNINRIGIHGMGGAGKTTLAYEVARRAEHKRFFNAIVVVEISHNPNIKQIQDRIAERIGFPINGIRTIEERGLHLYNRFKDIGRPTRKSKNDNEEAHGLEKTQTATKEMESNDELRTRAEECGKLLIILDNVWSRLDLRHFGIGHDLATDFKCKVVITSRQEDVCKQMGATHPYIFKVGDLNPNEAELLFRVKVGDTLEQSPIYEEIMKKILSKCSCLPLSISILANTLKNQGLDFWESVDRKLKNCGQGEAAGMLSEIHSIIKMSYDNIGNPEKKRLFLLSCLFPLGSNIQIVDLLRYGIGFGLFQNMNSLSDALEEVQNWMDELKSLSLLLEIDTQKEKIRVHDDVREAGRYIATHDNKGKVFAFHVGSMPGWLEKRNGLQYNAVTMVSDDNYRCLPNLHLPNVELLRLEGASNLCDDYFSRMQKIKVLDLAKSDIEKIPSSIVQLSGLKTLLLEGCMLDDISGICKLTMLKVLSLKGSNIRKLPEEMGNLVQLKLLDLTSCEKLEYIPAGGLGKLTQLEGLYMKDSFDDWGVEGCGDVGMASISELKNCSSLQVLEIKIRSTDQLVNHDFPFPDLALSRFHIGFGLFSEWGAILKSVELRRYMQVREIAGGDLLKEGWKTIMRKVEYLALYDVDGLSWSGLEGYRKVHRSLPDFVFCELKWLCLSNISGIEYALPAVDCGKALKMLQVVGCNDLRYVVCAPVTLEQIEFPCLETLHFENLQSLVGICEGTSTGSAEKGISIETLFTRKARFPSLEKLHLESINFIEQLWDMNSSQDLSTTFPKLKQMHIIAMPKLKHVWRSEQIISKGRSSSKLEDQDPTDVMNGLQCLTDLRISNCDAMKQIITCKAGSDDDLEDFMGTAVCFPKLMSLWLTDMINLVCFYQGIQDIEFPAVERLQLKCLDSFQTFIKTGQHPIYEDDDGDIVSDHVQYHTWDPANTLFTSAKTIFPSLKYLELESLDRIELLWDTIKDQQLRRAFPLLQSLQLRTMPMLKYVWDEERSRGSSFPNIKEVEIYDCGSIQSMCPPSTANHFKRLDRLSIMRCSKLKQVISTEEVDEEDEEEGGGRRNYSKIVPDNIIRLPKLSSLTLGVLESFTCFYQGNLNIELQALEEMTLFELGKFITFAKPFQQYWSDDPAQGYYVNAAAAWTRASLFFCDKVLLHSLKKLCVDTVDNIETIWDVGDHEDLAMELTKLETLIIICLPKLRAVWSGAKSDNLMGSSKGLKMIHLEKLPTIQVLVWEARTAIHYDDTITGMAARDRVEKVALFDGKFQLKNLEELTVSACESLEELFEMDGDHYTLPKLRTLKLSTLSNLRSFPCHMFPSLENLYMKRCCFRNKFLIDQSAKGRNGNLVLQQLKNLDIADCDTLKAIVGNDDDECMYDYAVEANDDDDDDDNNSHISFKSSDDEDSDGLFELPKLESVTLSGLTSIYAFCLLNIDLMLPSLKSVEVVGCSSILTFSSNHLMAPRLTTVVVDGEVKKVNEDNDLNTILALNVEEKYKDAENWPKISQHHRHTTRHSLVLSTTKGSYTCDVCMQQRTDAEWSYTCHDCSFVVHPSCIPKKFLNKQIDKSMQQDEFVNKQSYELDQNKQLLEKSNDTNTNSKVTSASTMLQRPLLPSKDWPEQAQHDLHADRHMLKMWFKLTTRRSCLCGVCGGPMALLSFWCSLCDFEAHPECVLNTSQSTEESNKQEVASIQRKLQSPPEVSTSALPISSSSVAGSAFPASASLFTSIPNQSTAFDMLMAHLHRMNRSFHHPPLKQTHLPRFKHLHQRN